MSSYKFKAFGHPNITGLHKTTVEFTKDRDMSPAGDCIIGVNSDFSLSQLHKCLTWRPIRIRLDCEGEVDLIKARINGRFDSDTEIVIRKGDFKSERTLACSADKGSADLNRNLIEKLKDPSAVVTVTIENEEKTA